MKVTVGGKEIELDSEPKHGVVRELRRQRNRIIMYLLTEAKDLLEKGVLKENMKLEEAIEVVSKMKPDLLSEFTQMQEEFEYMATISLATNRVWTTEELDELSESEFWELYEKCKEVIGGSAEDFFKRYENNISLRKK
ncbi:hypothetical protein Asulf_01534 [Archaeoglobus sulfaticallidus PM70-1]|uniref:Uncharacterized protein n=1 Tax=Archaeoglobus sulfaticallidus PM70-1 TaxID=387631 RepID=N0BGX8_9EURY|nr:hypothetical protein [Archaeoglobus sulfaticallidus]AGK61512.1 hypothetical protein Asulf_01534 [Archaeoglobus sulfaticallidus PM70-1]